MAGLRNPPSHNLNSAVIRNVNFGREHLFLRVVRAHELGKNLIILAQSHRPVIVSSQKLSATDFQHGKTHQLSLAEGRYVIPVITVKSLHGILVAEYGKCLYTVPESRGLLKIQRLGGGFHLILKFFVASLRFILKYGADFFDIFSIGGVGYLATAWCLASSYVIVHAWGSLFPELAAVP